MTDIIRNEAVAAGAAPSDMAPADHVRLLDRVASGARPEYLLARGVLLEELEPAQRAAKSGACALSPSVRSFARGRASGIALALSIFDAAEADRGTRAVTADILRVLVELNEEAFLAEGLPLEPLALSLDAEMLLVPAAEYRRVHSLVESALSLVAANLRRHAPAAKAEAP